MDSFAWSNYLNLNLSVFVSLFQTFSIFNEKLTFFSKQVEYIVCDCFFSWEEKDYYEQLYYEHVWVSECKYSEKKISAFH